MHRNAPPVLADELGYQWHHFTTVDDGIGVLCTRVMRLCGEVLLAAHQRNLGDQPPIRDAMGRGVPSRQVPRHQATPRNAGELMHGEMVGVVGEQALGVAGALEDGYSGGGVVGNVNDHERSSASILHQGVGRGLVPAGAGAE